MERIHKFISHMYVAGAMLSYKWYPSQEDYYKYSVFIYY